jgi:sugar lactone lactonase YvrE
VDKEREMRDLWLKLSKRPLRALVALAAVGAAALLAGGAALGDGRSDGESLDRPFSPGTGFATVYRSPLGLEGLTGDRSGNLYSVGRGDPCPVVRVKRSGGPAAVVGNIPAPCSPSGLAFNSSGRLFVADDDEILALTPNAANPPTAQVFATGVPGANGVAFDRAGALWVSDGTTGQGRVWRIGADGHATEAFRVQPLANDVNVVGGVGGVGRDVRSLPPGTVTITPDGRSAANTAGSQPLVANGLAFASDGALLVADTARGAIWRVELSRSGAVRSPVGCDTTFSANTLCLSDILVAHPLLEGADGIALDEDGTIVAAANERNALVAVLPDDRSVVELFRNRPAPATRLRNTGPLEFPTSPFLSDRTLCVAQSDGARRDNSPNGPGEVGPASAEHAKIACLDRPLRVPGEPLPVR